MLRQISLVIFILSLLSCTILFAEPPLDYEPSNNQNPVITHDLNVTIDANYLEVFVNNLGSIGYDQDNIYGQYDGWFYPHSVDNYPRNTVVYASGLWLGGKVNGEIRIAAAEYDQDFIPGPMENGTYLPDNPSFRVYKISQSLGPGYPDWDEWPAAQGAPVDEFGDPLLLGDETLWTVFNDADPNNHLYMETEPLGIEIQKTVWASFDPGEEIVLYVKYLLYNKGENFIDSFYISFWADADIGDVSDDLVGCDTISDIFYCYNDGEDHHYGDKPPAWGGKLLSGPVVPSPGDIAVFDGQPLPDYRNLRMTAFSKYINGTDPDNAQEAYNYMRGLNKDGSPMSDPDGVVTEFFAPGDPVTGVGWIDENSSDRRLMMTTGPFSFTPGDSQQVVIKFAVDHGNNAVHAIPRLKGTLDSLAVNLSFDPHNGVASIDTDTMHIFYSNYIGPDTMIATIYFGDFGDYPATYVLPNSVSINSKILPDSIWLTSHPDFTNDVVACTFKVPEFVDGYGPMWGTTIQQFSITGRFFYNNTFYCEGSFTMIGHRAGDVNTDGQIDISDAVFLINYIFNSDDAPVSLIIADCDCNDSVDISDAVYLIKYIFGNGPTPCIAN